MALYYWTIEARLNLSREEEARLIDEAMQANANRADGDDEIFPAFELYGNSERSTMIKHLLKSTTKAIKYTTKTKCREAVVGLLRDFIGAYYLGKKGSSKTTASTTTYFYAMTGFEIHIINHQHTLTDLGKTNMKNLLTKYLTSNSRLPVVIENDRLILNCGINPILISAALWFWRSFNQSINTEVFTSPTAFNNFLTEQYSRNCGLLPFSLLYFFVFWLKKYRSSGAIQLNMYKEAQWNGPQKQMHQTMFQDKASTQYFFQCMQQNIKTPLYSGFMRKLKDRFPIFSGVLKLTEAKNKMDASNNAQFFINLGEFIKKIEDFERSYGWLE